VLAPGDTKEKVADTDTRPVAGLLPLRTATRVVSDEQVALVPLKSVTENGEVPPVQVTVATTVVLCPESTTVGDKTTVGVDRAAFTVKSTVEELTDKGTEAPSATTAQ
jgi:hypothetical protein